MQGQAGIAVWVLCFFGSFIFMSKKNKKQLNKDSEKPGIAFEKVVAAMQKMMDPKASVEHNQKLRDRLGHLRQFDVVIRGKVGGHQVLGVIECKDLKRRVGTPEIEGFVTKARDVNANITLLASKRGFSKTALEKAKDYGIGTISLLPKDPKDCGFSVGVQWYAEIYSWSKVKLTLAFLAKKAPVEKCSPLDIKRGKFRVIDWFKRELATKYAKEEKEGWHSLGVVFDRPRKFYVGSKNCFIKGISFHALRRCQKKLKWVQLSGEGFFDWNQEKLTIPPKGKVCTDSFRTDFSDWEDFQGEIPPSAGILDWRIKAHLLPFDPKTTVIELQRL